MINLQDIRYYMNLALGQNFVYLKEEDQRRVIDTELRKYLTYKIKEYSPLALAETNNSSISDLIKYIADLNEDKNYFKNIQQVIHFILDQMGGIIWCENEDKPESEYPLLDIERRELHTRPDTDITLVFDFVYNIYLDGLNYGAKLNRVNNQNN